MFLIRPNAQNPDWPVEPAPEDLSAAIQAAEKAPDPAKALRDAPARALEKTRQRVAAQHRVGAGGTTDNLDWLDMVRSLRQDLREHHADGRRTLCWIDGLCPSLTSPLTLMVQSKHTEWGADGVRYRVVTFQVQDVQA